LIEPASTISTISTVAASVTRRPPENCDLMPRHHHRIDRGLLQQHDIAGEGARRLLLAHGVPAVFDHDDFLVVALHVRQRLGEDAGLVERGNRHAGKSLRRISAGL
jgi:hypothetical protein